jgi:hypothetical protein
MNNQDQDSEIDMSAEALPMPDVFEDDAKAAAPATDEEALEAML